MQFKGFTLDDFQIQAIKSIDEGNSCVVSASTGTGKTLIAEYIINKHLPENKITIYTAPIKALSNQKYKDFCNDYGKNQVGLLTGDLDINHDAPILIMTTEIYRNMLLTNDPMLDNVKYVIFDEVHYINDIQRGSVWEESIIFSPKHIRFLCLSATIPNYNQFANWIQTIKKHKVDTVNYKYRPVPLTHLAFDRKLGLTTIQEIEKDKLKDEEYSDILDIRPGGRKAKLHQKQKQRKFIHEIKHPHHIDVINEILQKLPALYFCFSRKKTEDFAKELSQKKDLVSTEEKVDITNTIRDNLNPTIASMDTTRLLRQTLSKGIGFHHSGMLPGLKNIVEILFAKGLIKVLYTTETFSVGINMPAKAVIFDDLNKYDGINFRMLNSKEYFQIAGRAGRRGIDKEGTVISLINRRLTDLEKLDSISTKDDEPIISQFKLSINTILNLIHNFDDKTQEILLRSNFDHYVRTKSNQKSIRVIASFRNKRKKLEKLNFIKNTKKLSGIEQGGYIEYDKNYILTEKGLFARNIYSQEIALTELFFMKNINQISDLDLLIILATLVYEERRNDYFMIKGCEKTYDKILKILNHTYLEKELNKISLKRMINYVTCWAQGGKFLELMKYTNLQEGDIIRFFRRLIDVLSQLKHATENEELKDRMSKLSKLIDRDLIADF
ncbi:MAG: DEAD/DEAH box helicase [Candidatus Woesearchaeota archaeon]